MKIAEGKFVVTGGASLIGSHVAEQLIGQGAREVVLLDNYALGSPDTVRSLLENPRIKLVRGDILRINELYDAFEGADGVFAIAGFLTLPLSQNPSLGLAVNVDGQVNIFEACRYRGVRKVVFSSSVAVYGDPAPGLIDEKTPASLATFQPAAALYACTKLIGENLCGLYSARHGVQAIALRYSTVYGERQHYRGVNALYIMENYDRIMRGERPTIPDDGSEVHDYIHVSDVARANVLALEHTCTGPVNIGTGLETDVNTLYSLLCEAAGVSLGPVHLPAKPGEQLRSSIDNALAKRVLGWQPTVGLREGLRQTIEFFRARSKREGSGPG